MTKEKGRRVLIVDDDMEQIKSLTELLTREGNVVNYANDAEGALHRVRAWEPNIILLDVQMPGESGIELIPKIRSIPFQEYCAIMLVSANADSETIIGGLEAGADDYLTKPYRLQDILVRLRVLGRLKDLNDTIRRSQVRIEELATTDGLTHLLNWTAFIKKGEEEILKTKRFRKPTTLMWLDVDGFGKLNQGRDFTFGNFVLQELSKILRQKLRSNDLLARVGGDEFAVLLPETDLSGGQMVAERMLDAVQKHGFRLDKETAQLTVSIGVSGYIPPQMTEGTVPMPDCNFMDLLRFSFEAMRQAQESGGAKIEVYSFL